MNVENFVQNVKSLCAEQGVKPTVACRESGAGKDLMSQLEKRGIIPSIDKIQKLASYLGTTVSALLGEEKGPTTVSDDGPAVDADIARITDLLSRATPETKKALLVFLEQLQGGK